MWVGANKQKYSQAPKNHTLLYMTLWKEALFTMGVMSARLYCFRQPSEPKPRARSLEELQMESITVHFDAWESLDIDLGWWQFPRKCWGNQSGQCAGAICESMPSATKSNKAHTMVYVLPSDNQPTQCSSCPYLKMVNSLAQSIFFHDTIMILFEVTQTTERYELVVIEQKSQLYPRLGKLRNASSLVSL